VLNTKLKYGMDVGDQLIAVENAISSIQSAMEELQGIGELSDLFEALDNDLNEAEQRKDELESYMSGEYQAQIDELTREYYRSVI
jgi:DNA repair ATPase RecN